LWASSRKEASWSQSSWWSRVWSRFQCQVSILKALLWCPCNPSPNEPIERMFAIDVRLPCVHRKTTTNFKSRNRNNNKYRNRKQKQKHKQKRNQKQKHKQKHESETNMTQINITQTPTFLCLSLRFCFFLRVCFFVAFHLPTKMQYGVRKHNPCPERDHLHRQRQTRTINQSINQ